MAVMVEIWKGILMCQETTELEKVVIVNCVSLEQLKEEPLNWSLEKRRGCNDVKGET